MPDDFLSVTELLSAYRAKWKGAFDQPVERLYAELDELAHIQLRNRHPGETP